MVEEVKEEQQNMNPFDIDLSLLEVLSESLDSRYESEEAEQEEIVQEDIVAEETEEKQEVSETEEDDKGVPSSHETKDASPFIPYAKLLVEEGITPNFKLEEFDGTPQGLLKAFDDELEYRWNTLKEEKLHPRVKWLQDNLDEGVAFEELLKIDSQRISLNNVKPEEIETNPDIQKEVVRQYYKETTKFNDVTINKAIERLEATGDLGEESKTFFEELKQINSVKEQQMVQQAQMQRQAEAKAQQEALDTFKKTLDSKKEIVTGITLTPVMKDAIYKTLTTPVDTDPQTGMPLNEIAKARQADPMNFEINLAYVFKATKGFTDWSVFSGAGKKVAIKEFEDSVRKLDFTQTKQNLSKPDINRDLIEQMEIISRQARNY